MLSNLQRLHALRNDLGLNATKTAEVEVDEYTADDGVAAGLSKLAAHLLASKPCPRITYEDLRTALGPNDD